MVAKGEGEGVGWPGGLRLVDQLLHLKWTSNHVLAYSTGNYIQSLGIDLDEDNLRRGMYVYV